MIGICRTVASTTMTGFKPCQKPNVLGGGWTIPVYATCFNTSLPGNPGREDLGIEKTALGRVRGWNCGVSATFLVRILISRGFESVNTVFGADFVFGRKNSSSPTTEGK